MRSDDTADDAATVCERREPANNGLSAEEGYNAEMNSKQAAFCDCRASSDDKQEIRLTLGSEIVTGEQTVPCPLCHKILFRSVDGRKILKATIEDHD